MKRLLIILAFAAGARAQVVATAGRFVAVAHDRRLELFDDALRPIWSVQSVPNASRVVIGPDRIVVIDSSANDVEVYRLESGQSEHVVTDATPVDAVFIARTPYILDRDAQRVFRPAGPSVGVGPDTAFIRATNDKLYVYSRLDGYVAEIEPLPMILTHTVRVPPFASDFEVDGKSGYLVYPAEAKIRTVELATMRRTGDISAGVVPVDLSIASRGNGLSASRLAVADPSAKRVWVVEGAESISAAVARGFLRGLLGLGLFRPASAQFPTGVDRVMTSGSITLAYDSTTRTLYRVNGSKSTVVARDLGAGSFAIAGNAITVWQNGSLRLIR
jgi:hypothetical protein